MSKQVLVFVGTSKGGFIFSNDAKRRKWQMSDILFKSWNMMRMRLDPRDNRLHAAVSHFVYGPTTHYSDDFGANTGQLFYRRDSGDSWELLADFMPPIQSVEAAVVER
jgi:hypothetical protein